MQAKSPSQKVVFHNHNFFKCNSITVNYYVDVIRYQCKMYNWIEGESLRWAPSKYTSLRPSLCPVIKHVNSKLAISYSRALS